MIHKVPPLSLNLIVSQKHSSDISFSSEKKVYKESNSDPEDNLLETQFSPNTKLEDTNNEQEKPAETNHLNGNIPEHSQSEESLHTFNYYQDELSHKISLDNDFYQSDSENIETNDPESSLKEILNNPKPKLTHDLIERPNLQLIDESESSELEWDSGIILHPDSNISEQHLDDKFNPVPDMNFLENFDNEIEEMIRQEVDSFIGLVKFKNSQKEIDPSIEFIDKYLKILLRKMSENEEEMLENINNPAYQDPLGKIAMLQNSEIGKLSKFPVLELILPSELSNELKFELGALEYKSKQIYMQMIFDCVNESLNFIRPFGTNGLPDP